MAFLFILCEPFGLLIGQFTKLGLTMHSETHSSRKLGEAYRNTKTQK